MRPDNVIPFPRQPARQPNPIAAAEALAEILAQGSTEVSRLIHAHEHAARKGYALDPRRLYDQCREAFGAAADDSRAVLARLDAITQDATGGTAS